MKISIICLALATVLSVAGAAVINQDECFAEGGPCHTLKRAASALAEANIFDGQHHNTAHHQCEDAGAICYKSKRDVCGPSCLKAKRDALALAEAFAEAAPFAEPIHRQCFGSGGICYKAKRDAVEAAADFADAEASTDPDTQDDVQACHETGGPCESVKRAAKAAAEAMAEAEPGFRDRPSPHQCLSAGAICYKAKRALDGLTGVVDGIVQTM